VIKTPLVRQRSALAVAADPRSSARVPRDAIQFCKLLHANIARQMDAPQFFVGLYDATSQTVEVVWQVDHGKELSGGSFPIGAGLTRQVVVSERAEASSETTASGVHRAALAAPLRLQDQTIGLVCVESSRQGAYDDHDLRLLETVANDAAAVIVALVQSDAPGGRAQHQVAQLEAILANMPDGLLIVDGRGRLVRLNDSARQLLGLEEPSLVVGQALDRNQWRHWPVAARGLAEALASVVDHLRRSGQPQEVQVELPSATNHRVMSISARALSGPTGGGVIVMRDVTVQFDSHRFKDEMFSIASHDLKMPATVIKTEAQSLKRLIAAGKDEPGEIQESLSLIVKQADRLSTLLNLLFDVSRMDAGQLGLDLELTDLRNVLLGPVRALQSASAVHEIELRAPTAVIGHFDRRRLERVVENLLSNALKYSPDGGLIEVQLECDATGATVSVRDQGVGLAPGVAAHAFERFYRGPAIRHLEGGGLGLYICQAIVAAHGGQMWAESRGPGLGSTFSFRLPLRA
jgi:signal transduction histidine kinase